MIINQKILKPKLLILLVILNLLLTGCINQSKSNYKETQSLADDSESISKDVTLIVEGNNKFALEMYSKIVDDQENVFFSPYSISLTFAMLYEGARGDTTKEIGSIFHFDHNNTTRRSSFAKLYNDLISNNDNYIFDSSNALWVQENYKLLKEYISIINKYYMGDIKYLDFANNSEKSNEKINSWIYEQTNNKIKEFIPEGQINSLTTLILTNALIFKGYWYKPFDKKDTQIQNFTLISNKTSKVQMMSLRTEEFNYYKNDEFQMLELPYNGNDISMMIFLPINRNLKSFESSFTYDNITKWKNNLKKQEIKIYLPKFKLNLKYSLNDILEKMGMSNVLSDSADFSGLTGSKDLNLETAFHQAYIEVNEEGSEASVVTSVDMSAGITPTFKADHPFIFIIQSRQSEQILFIGRYSNPVL
jgi:serpin B